MDTYQIDKTASAKIFLYVFAFFPADENQFLAEFISYRDNDTSAISELVQQRVRDFGGTCSHHDGAEGSELSPTKCPVKGLALNVAIP